VPTLGGPACPGCCLAARRLAKREGLDCGHGTCREPPRALCLGPMSPSESPAATGLTPDERAYIRRELDLFFSTLPRVADGLYPRTWRGGPQAGQLKLPLAAQGLLARGLVRLDASLRPPRLFFTEAGLTALRAMMADARLSNPVTFAHVRQELGIEDSP
jgi:hypothetical protein